MAVVFVYVICCHTDCSALREDGLGGLAESVRACLEQHGQHITHIQPHDSATSMENHGSINSTTTAVKF